MRTTRHDVVGAMAVVLHDALAVEHLNQRLHAEIALRLLGVLAAGGDLPCCSRPTYACIPAALVYSRRARAASSMRVIGAWLRRP